ncbi:uncharacterized protein LOC111616021, partial [Centruroides sculpturatus]|uniref:uncharacterized protein LOC111616021 n=1 Tax=Centruroides sculpturatus TaxID=218467 RepID=UPI000C6DF3BA
MGVESELQPSLLRFMSPVTEVTKLGWIRQSLTEEHTYSIFWKGDHPLRRLRPPELHAVLREYFPNPEKILDVRYTRNGLLLLKTLDPDVAATALGVTSLGDTPVYGRLAQDCVSTGYVIRGVDTTISAKEIHDLLEAGVPILEVRRFTRKVEGVMAPSTTVYLSVASVTPLAFVKLYYQRFRCERFYPRPRLCLRCLNYGHGQANCRGSRKCLKCGRDHDATDCEADNIRCARCGGEHTADSAHCPEYQREARILKLRTLHRCSHMEARGKLEKTSQSPKTYAQAARVISGSQAGDRERVRQTQSKQASGNARVDEGVLRTLISRIANLETAIVVLRNELFELRKSCQGSTGVVTQGSQQVESREITHPPGSGNANFKRPSQ